MSIFSNADSSKTCDEEDDDDDDDDDDEEELSALFGK